MFGRMKKQTGKTIYLAKANDDVISHCRCRTALITWPPQMDCPWCGCGWLFTCIECHKAFTFAKGVLIDESLEEIATKDIRSRFEREPESDEIANWLKGMRVLLKGIELGREYVYLDGYFIPSDSESVTFEGWTARHDLPHMPQAEARSDGTILDRSIGAINYWRTRRVEHDESEPRRSNSAMNWRLRRGWMFPPRQTPTSHR